MQLIRVTEAEYRGDYRIFLKFNDGLSGEVDLSDKLWGEIFEPLKDQAFYKDFHLNEWTIEWKNGADFAPESLHKMVEEQNQSVA